LRRRSCMVSTLRLRAVGWPSKRGSPRNTEQHSLSAAIIARSLTYSWDGGAW